MNLYSAAGKMLSITRYVVVLAVVGHAGAANITSPQPVPVPAPLPFRGLALIVFNATLPADQFTVDGNNFYDNVSRTSNM